MVVGSEETERAAAVKVVAGWVEAGWVVVGREEVERAAAMKVAAVNL